MLPFFLQKGSVDLNRSIFLPHFHSQQPAMVLQPRSINPEGEEHESCRNLARKDWKSLVPPDARYADVADSRRVPMRDLYAPLSAGVVRIEKSACHERVRGYMDHGWSGKYYGL